MSETDTSHTPGPWQALTLDTNSTLWHVMAREGRICTMHAVVNLSETAANARLIAAAPDLLAVCERALTDPEGLTDSPLQAQLRAALAKARGD